MIDESIYHFKKQNKHGVRPTKNEIGDVFYKYFEKSSNDGGFKSALKWITYSAEIGNVKAQRMLNDAYQSPHDTMIRDMFGSGMIEDMKISIMWGRRASRQGDSMCSYNLGQFYEKGEYVRRSYKKAIEYYKKSIDQDANYKSGRDALIRMVRDGKGFAKDVEKSLNMMLENFHNDNNMWIALDIVKIYRDEYKDIPKTIEWLLIAIDNGNLPSQTELALLLMNDDEHQDYPMAYQLFKDRSEYEYIISEHYMAVMEYDGKGITQNKENAIKKLKLLATQYGHKLSEIFLEKNV